MNIKEFIVDNLVLLYKGSFSQKLLASAQLSLAPAAALTLTERISGWYVESEFFLFCLCVVLAIDHILDSYVHLIILKDFTFKGNLKELITKLSIISIPSHFLYKGLSTLSSRCFVKIIGIFLDLKSLINHLILFISLPQSL